MSDITLDDEHPLALELASLRAAVARYQHEAHSASLKLQRHSLGTTLAVEHTHALEQENARLREEVEALRSGTADAPPQSANLQVSELTLSLRKLSDKLTFTEEALFARSTELAHAKSELGRAKHEVDTTMALARRVNSRAEDLERRERDLERKARAAEEERKLADLVVEEYAALVRKLEGRPSRASSASHDAGVTSSPAALREGLAEGRAGLQRLFGEFNAEVDTLSSELSRIRAESEQLHATLEAEKQRSEADRESLAKVMLELDKYKADDSTAAKMVARYMKFSQSTTDSLQKSMDNLRARHAATVTTLNTQIEHLHKALMSERRQTERLRDALDQLSEDISREAYGRRREISLRLAFLGREEALAESLRRWVRKAKESSDRAFSQANEPDATLTALHDVVRKVLYDAERLLELLNGQPSPGRHAAQGSVARIVAAQSAVSALTRELQDETHRRLEAQRMLSHIELAVEEVMAEMDQSEAPLTPPQSTSSLSLPAAEAVEKDVDLEQWQPAQPDNVDCPPAIEDHIEEPPTVPEPLEESEAQAVKPTSSSDSPLGPEDTPASPTPTIPDSIEPIPPNSFGSLIEELVHDVADVVSPTSADITPPHGTGQSPTPLPTIHIVLVDEEIQGDGHSNHEAQDVRSPLHPLETDSHKQSITPSDDDSDIGDVVCVQTTPAVLHHPTPKVPFSSPIIQDLLDLTARDSTPDLPSVAVEFVPEDGATDVSSPVASPSPPPVAAEESAAADVLADSTKPSLIHPLLAALDHAKHRYDGFQKSFRDCCLSLKELKKDVGALDDLSAAEMAAVIRTAVERLNDFNEDTRVELEIRVADEERMISGYETLLSVPGAMTSDELDEQELTHEIEAFVSGTSSSVSKASQQFSRKLDDLQHDIACLKRSLHELASEEISAPRPATPTTNAHGWSSWTGGILGGGSSRPVSPAPTFGSVMTAPRLRQSSFGSFMHRPSLPNLHSASSVSSSATERGHDNPFATLGLRISMPAHAVPQVSPTRGMFLSPRLSPGAASRPQKPRAASASMYMLGLGASGATAGYGFAAQNGKSPSSKLAADPDEGAEADSDVE